MPSFSDTVNTTYINNLTKQIRAVNTCSELQKLENEIAAEMEKYIADILKQVSLYGGLITAPTDLPSVITWIGNLIQLYTAPYTKAIQQATQLIAAYEQLVNAIMAKSNSMQCNLTAPTIPHPTLPTL